MKAVSRGRREGNKITKKWRNRLRGNEIEWKARRLVSEGFRFGGSEGAGKKPRL